MRKLTFTNSAGVSIEFFKTPYLIEKLDGIDTPAAAIQEQKAPYQDGTTYIDTLLNNREIVIRGAIVAPKVLAPIANYRGTLQAAMNPKLGMGTITFQNDSVTRYASGYVSSCLLPNKDAREPYQRFQITIICPDPFWYGAPVTVTSTGLEMGTRTLPSSAAWADISYGDGVFCTVGDTNKAAISTDGGNTWSAKTLPSNVAGWNSIAYGNGVFCAIVGGISSRAAISTDGGNTWIEKTIAFSYCKSIAYGGGVFCALTATNTQIIISIDGGNTWSAKTLPSAAQWNSIAYGNGVFCTIALNSNKAAISTDGGNTWSAKTLPSTDAWIDISYGGGTFCVICTSADKSAISTDGGNTWSAKTLSSSSSWNSIAYGAGCFFAVSLSSDVSAISIDGGNTWIAKTLPSSVAWRAIAYGNGAFCVVSPNSDISAFLTGTTVNIPSELPTPVTLTISGPNTAIAVTNNEETLSVSKALVTGERIIINTAFGQKAITYYPVSGTPSNAMQYLDVDSVFWQLQPGYNNVFFTSAASITYRVKYIGV